MTFLIIAALIGLLPAFIAQGKGRSFVGWWIYGALMFIVALPHALLVGPVGGRKCPSCAEQIKREALVCRFCGRDVPPLSTALTAEPDPNAY